MRNSEGQTEIVHRLVYKLLVDDDVVGKDVHHLCGNPPCINPSHLVALPRLHHIALSPNMKGFSAAALGRCRNGHSFTPDNTAYLRSGVRYCKACSRIKHERDKHRYPDRQSIHKGVYWDRRIGAWRCQITSQRQPIHLGVFQDEHEAAYVFEQVHSQLLLAPQVPMPNMGS